MVEVYHYVAKPCEVETGEVQGHFAPHHFHQNHSLHRRDHQHVESKKGHTFPPSPLHPFLSPSTWACITGLGFAAAFVVWAWASATGPLGCGPRRGGERAIEARAAL